MGQSPTHDRMSLDHREALDIALQPGSTEGRELMLYLRKTGIPFIAFRGQVRSMSTGAHIHIAGRRRGLSKLSNDRRGRPQMTKAPCMGDVPTAKPSRLHFYRRERHRVLRVLPITDKLLRPIGSLVIVFQGCLGWHRFF